MFVRTKYLFMVIFLLCLVGAGSFCLMASAGESEGKKGKAEITWLYPPKYYRGNAFSEGRAWVQEEEDGPWSLLDDQGNVLKTGLKASLVSDYKDGIASFLPRRLPDDGIPSGHGFLNRSGDVVLPPGAYDGIYGDYSEGLIAREGKNGLWGFIDLSGTWVIPPAYDMVFPFSEGLTAVQKGSKWGFIDKKGTVVIDFKFGGTYGFFHKMAAVRVGSKWGVIDPKGHWIAEPIYDELGAPYLSYPIAFERDGEIGFINSEGEVALDFQHTADWKYCILSYSADGRRAKVIAEDFDEKNPEYGIIDESGKVLFRRKNCSLTFKGNYILCFYGDRQSSLIDSENREYDLPDGLEIVNGWIAPDEKSPYPFMIWKDGKYGYATISVKRN